MDKKKLFETDYGYFTEDGSEYVITRPDTPKPWVNVICPGDYGMTVSQSGSGYSWRTHASLNRINRWNQDLVSDEWGKYIYVRDENTGKFWSASWKPVAKKPQFYECRHGMGYTKIISRNEGIQTDLLLFVPPKEPLEIWKMTVNNLSPKKRVISLWSYLEWCLGESPDSHREFHRTFIETELDRKERAIFAGKRIWTIPNAKGQHWNRTWDYVAWNSVSAAVSDLNGNKDSFIGQHGNPSAPLSLKAGKYLNRTTGKWDDSIASFKNVLSLRPGESKTIVWTMGAATSKKEALSLLRKYRSIEKVEKSFAQTKLFWNDYIGRSKVETPDSAFNIMADKWLKYQALSSRIWGRTAYYQTGGAIGYRDQLQDSQIFLHLEPERTKKQILLHAAHQYSTGIVQHWWHPITNEGHKSGYSDDLLWLPFVTVNYLKETGDFSILNQKAPFLPDSNGDNTPPATLYEHCNRAIRHSLQRRSKRGIPLIGTGDWNDGLSTTGWEGKGESVWVAIFLYGILNDFNEAIHHAIKNKTLSAQEYKRIAYYKKSARQLYQAVNRYGWDGKWYWTASCDDGTILGGHKTKEGKIHLNPQSWTILNKMVPKGRLKPMLQSVEKYLYRNYGPLLLYPAYQVPDERVGYLTRYAPGVRENGGLYTHAGVWAIQMECFLKRNDKAWELFRKICPIYRGEEPELYQCEPYVTPGNVDGPDSPNYGRGGWTWYTGSAAWFYRIMTEWILGVRPVWDGLLIDPCLPSHWKEFKMIRIFRGCKYEIQIKKKKLNSVDVRSIEVDGERIFGNTICCTNGRKNHKVEVFLE